MHLNTDVDRFISIIRAFRKHQNRGCSARINLIGRDTRIIQSARSLRLVIVSIGKDFVHETVSRWYLKAVQPCLEEKRGRLKADSFSRNWKWLRNSIKTGNSNLGN